MRLEITPAPGTCCPDMKCICEGCGKDYTDIIWSQREEIRILRSLINLADFYGVRADGVSEESPTWISLRESLRKYDAVKS